MRRLLKPKTWLLRGGNAAESSMVVAVGCLIMPLVLFVGASWLAYGEVQQQADERLQRTLDLLYVNVRTTFETEYLVATNVDELVDNYTNEGIAANEESCTSSWAAGRGLLQVEDVCAGRWRQAAGHGGFRCRRVSTLPIGLIFLLIEPASSNISELMPGA